MPRENRISLLHPKARQTFKILQEDLVRSYEAGEVHSPLYAFETFRSVERQESLFIAGRSKARAWQSAHNYGLAVDFVPFVKDKTAAGTKNVGWSWEVSGDIWDHLTRSAEKVGLFQNISWDRAHVVHPLWFELRRLVLK